MFRRIRDLREDGDYTQEQIGKILYCSRQMYSRYELGKASIPVEMLIRLADFYKVSVDYLLGIRDE